MKHHSQPQLSTATFNVAVGPWLAGSQGEHQAAAWLATQFTNLGYAVTIQQVTQTAEPRPVGRSTYHLCG